MRAFLRGLRRLNTVLRSVGWNSGDQRRFSNDQTGSRWNSGDQRRFSDDQTGSRWNSGDQTQLRCYRLTHRCVIHLRGQDTSSFLQGLITNNVHLLDEEPHLALYAHMLSVQGRTLYDVIVYRPMESSGDVLLECDGSALDSITLHLKTYRIRRKVSVETRADLALWALLGGGGATPGPRGHSGAVLVADPRTHLMGWRLIAGAGDDPPEFIASCSHGNDEEYHRHRYRLGVPEGMRDLPPGDALPLESNLVFLKGISFSKGCYLGQELTARTHHTGVVRKRLMPVRLSEPAGALQPESAVLTQEGRVAGKLRSGVGELWLGLVRLGHVRETLTVADARGQRATVTPTVPEWWPEDIKGQLQT